jgi:hypothetical protein
MRGLRLIWLALLVACGSALSSAKTDFNSGRVAEAKEKLVALEPDSRSWDGARRAEYVLYRGLVEHSLGDRDRAALWLREAKAIEDLHPKTLSEDDKIRLDLALDALGPSAPQGPR